MRRQRQRGKWVWPLVGMAGMAVLAVLAWLERTADPLVKWERVGEPPASSRPLIPVQTSPAEIPGPVIAAFPLAMGKRAYAWCRSQYSPDHFIRILKEGEITPVHEFRIGFAAHLFTADDMRVYYATENARVGAVDAEARLIWEVTHTQTPTALAISEDAITLLGDRRGSVTAFDDNGRETWNRSWSRSPIVGLFTKFSNCLIAWDTSQRIYLGRPDGTMVWSNVGFPVVARMGNLISKDQFEVLDNEGGRWRVMVKTNGLQVISSTGPVNKMVWWWSGLALCLGILLLEYFDWRKLSNAAWQSRSAYLMLLPSITLLLLFEYGPAVAALVQSLFTMNLTHPARFVGLDNFRQLWGDSYIWTGFLNLGLITLGGMVKLTIPLLAAELVFWLSTESWRQLYRTLFLLPGVVPGLVTILLWKMIYDPGVGLANQLLAILGLEQFARAWLAEESTALLAVMFTGFPWISITAFLVFLGGLLGIPISVFESAELDGVGRWRRFFSIDLPLIIPQLRLLIILTIIHSIQELSSVLVMTRGGPGISTYTPALYMFLETTEGANIGYASSIGIALFLIAIGASWLVSYSFNRLEK